MFLGELLRGLTERPDRAGAGRGGEDDPFASMLQDEYGKLISRSGGIGIADAVLRELLVRRRPHERAEGGSPR